MVMSEWRGAQKSICSIIAVAGYQGSGKLTGGLLMASWSEIADSALLAAAVACRYHWPNVAAALERAGHGARTAQACEHRLRLLLERERTLRKEHLRRLIAEPVTRAKRTDALFREAEALNAKRADGDVTFPQGDVTFPQMGRRRPTTKASRTNAILKKARRERTRRALIARAELQDWKRALLAKAAKEREAERKADTRSLTGQFFRDPHAGAERARPQESRCPCARA